MADNDEKEFDIRAAAERRSKMIQSAQGVRDIFRRIESVLTTKINEYYSMTPASEAEEESMNRDMESALDRVWRDLDAARSRMKSM